MGHGHRIVIPTAGARFNAHIVQPHCPLLILAPNPGTKFNLLDLREVQRHQASILATGIGPVEEIRAQRNGDGLPCAIGDFQGGLVIGDPNIRLALPPIAVGNHHQQARLGEAGPVRLGFDIELEYVVAGAGVGRNPDRGGPQHAFVADVPIGAKGRIEPSARVVAGGTVEVNAHGGQPAQARPLRMVNGEAVDKRIEPVLRIPVNVIEPHG